MGGERRERKHLWSRADCSNVDVPVFPWTTAVLLHLRQAEQEENYLVFIPSSGNHVNSPFQSRSFPQSEATQVFGPDPLFKNFPIFPRRIPARPATHFRIYNNSPPNPPTDFRDANPIDLTDWQIDGSRSTRGWGKGKEEAQITPFQRGDTWLISSTPYFILFY